MRIRAHARHFPKCTRPARGALRTQSVSGMRIPGLDDIGSREEPPAESIWPVPSTTSLERMRKIHESSLRANVFEDTVGRLSLFNFFFEKKSDDVSALCRPHFFAHNNLERRFSLNLLSTDDLFMIRDREDVDSLVEAAAHESFWGKEAVTRNVRVHVKDPSQERRAREGGGSIEHEHSVSRDRELFCS